MSKGYVSLAFLDEVREKVEEWISSSGGSMELTQLEALLQQEFHYPIKGSILTEKKVDSNQKLRAMKDRLLRYECGKVYLNYFITFIFTNNFSP